MGKYIRRMFWTFSLMGGISIVQALFKPNFLASKIASDRSVKENELEAKDSSPLMKSMTSLMNKGLVVAQKGLDSVCKDCGLKLSRSNTNSEGSLLRTDVGLPGDAKSNRLKSGNPYSVETNGRKYVYRDGKYYRAIDSNVYLDSEGNPTLVIDNAQSRYEKEEDEERDSNNRFRPDVVKKTQLAKLDGSANEDFVKSGAPSITGSYSPEGIKGMVETIKEAKRNMAERNRVLEQMDREDKKRPKSRP